jgi:hypothetical protein
MDKRYGWKIIFYSVVFICGTILTVSFKSLLIIGATFFCVMVLYVMVETLD